jgi:uncharacterized membrane protein YphA (DoxX/SURF4 family)
MATAQRSFKSPKTDRPARTVVLWVLSVLAAAEFLFAGGLKLVGNETMVAIFRQIGWGDWFRYFIGVIEVLGGIGLLFPPRARGAALVLSLVMIGAIVMTFTALRGLPNSSPLPAIVTLLVLLIIARIRRAMQGA